MPTPAHPPNNSDPTPGDVVGFVEGPFRVCSSDEAAARMNAALHRVEEQWRAYRRQFGMHR